ncbi:MAG: hypothetical protein EOO53_14085 [Gammaproteobacteria bacterium]|nr:MAG: hypothetical protein EOO53_14085 [Gammaproteobacteria bacterium]
MKCSMRPVVITAFKIRADLIRQVASEYNYAYEETAVTGSEDLIKFFFNQLDDVNTNILVAAIPLDIFAYKAVIGD